VWKTERQKWVMFYGRLFFRATGLCCQE